MAAKAAPENVAEIKTAGKNSGKPKIEAISKPRTSGDLRKTGQKFQAQYPPVYKFHKPGDYLQGAVLRLKTVHPGGRTALVMVLAAEQGQYTIWPNTMLCTLLTEKSISEGDLIGIEFKGLKQSTNDARYTYEEYELYTE